jgi:2-polyprenyl-6-hydroxyphenyl methylase/3-demethylubiquinone-9 3-methyltransferase
LVRAGGCWISFCGFRLPSHLSEIAVTKIASEIERFNRFSVTWWDAEGPMRPLHIVNALRLGYVIERIALHLGLSTSNISLENVRILDVGCGGGLLSEPLARLGAKVVGVDASKGNIEAARLHAASQGVGVDYRLGEPSEVLGPNERFDVVLALEVVEHVSDVATFLDTTARSVAPGGLLFVSTIDRTWKSFVFAIVGAEYVLRVLPRGTHHWSQFVRPAEIAVAVEKSGLKQTDLKGMSYDPFRHTAAWCQDTRVNYMAVFKNTNI